MNNAITVETVVRASLAKVWEYWNKPEHITGWAFASDDWQASSAENDLQVGGKFKTAMAPKDGSAGFDFSGTYTAVNEHELLTYRMDDGRQVTVKFESLPEGVKIIEAFEPENENPEEMQRAGWQAILNNFAKYAEGRS